MRERVLGILDKSPDLLEWYLLKRGAKPRLAEILDKNPEFVEEYLTRKGQAPRLAEILDKQPEFIQWYMLRQGQGQRLPEILDKRRKTLTEYLDNRPKFLEAYLIQNKESVGLFVDKYPMFIGNYLNNPKDRPHRRDAFKQVVEKHPELLDKYINSKEPEDAFRMIVEKHPKLLDDHLLSKAPILARFIGQHPEYANKCFLCRKRAIAQCVDKHPDYIIDYLSGRKPAAEYFDDGHKNLLTDYLLEHREFVVQFLDNYTFFVDEYLKGRPAYLINHLHHNRVSEARIPPEFFTKPFTLSPDLFNDCIDDLPDLPDMPDLDTLIARSAVPKLSTKPRNSAPTTTAAIGSAASTNPNCPPLVPRAEGAEHQREAPAGSSAQSNRSKPQPVITIESDEEEEEPEVDEQEDDEDDNAEEEYQDDEEFDDDDDNDNNDDDDDDDDEDYGGRPTSRVRSDLPPLKTPQPFKNGIVGQTTAAPSSSTPSSGSTNRSALITSSTEQPDGQLVQYPASPRLLNASQGQSPGPKNSWRLYDEDRAIYHMLVIKDEKTLVQNRKNPKKQTVELTFKGEARFEEVSRRMKIEGLDRSWVSIRNQWNRTLRLRSGFDERKNKQAPLATSKQGKKVQGTTRQRKTPARQETTMASQAPAVASSGPAASASQGAPPDNIDPALTTATQAPTAASPAPTATVQALRATSEGAATKKRKREVSEKPKEAETDAGVYWDDDEAYSSEDDEAFARRLASGLRPRKRR